MVNNVRVRIAPSPTGDPHVGTAYVALFNYVFARKHGGKFVLRIEDTDQARAKHSSEDMIGKSLRWVGLDWDEGPDKGGPYGPYRQSERRQIYTEHVQKLLNNGTAYRCFCSPERLDQMRVQLRLEGKPPGYDRLCRSLSPEEVQTKLDAKIPSVIRLKMPTDGSTTFVDEIRGKIEFENHRLDDQVLMKSDGFPTYHLANVVDDYLMKITHVIRAEEWISSTPKHVILYQSFGWPEPKWVHLPLLRNADRSKISKRKNPVSLTYYQRAGILPHALLNFLALMGWSFGNDREIFTIPEMQEVFDLKNISLGGPVFDLVKLTWLNQHYMHKMSDDEFVNYMHKELFNTEYLKRLKPLVLERLSRFEQFVDQNSFFFNGALNYDGLDTSVKGKTQDEINAAMTELVEHLDELYEWDNQHITDLLAKHKEKLGWKPKDYFMTIRLVVTGRKDSPPLTETIAALGREMVRFRIRDFVTKKQGENA
ncbi:MAG: glutamate--tRNA ligase [Oligoflexales bacterium]